MTGINSLKWLIISVAFLLLPHFSRGGLIPKVDSIQIFNLINDAEILRINGDLDGARTKALEVRKRSQELNFFEGYVRSKFIEALIDATLPETRAKAYILGSELASIGLQLSDTTILIKSKNLLGYIAHLDRNWPKSQGYYLEMLKYAEQGKRPSEIASACRQLGVALIEQSEDGNAPGLIYYQRALDIYQNLNDTAGVAGMYYVMGIAYTNLKRYEEGMRCQVELMNYHKENNDTISFVRAQNELSSNLLLMGDIEGAYNHALDSYKLLKLVILSDKELLANTCAKIIGALEQLNRPAELKTFLDEQLMVARQSQSKNQMLGAYTALTRFYRNSGNYKLALEFNDSMNILSRETYSSDLTKQMADAQASYDNDKKQLQIENLEKEKIHEEQILAHERTRSTIIIISVSVGLGTLIVFSIFLFNRFKVTQRQNRIIENQQRETEIQKHLVEIKNKEILDSIQYAKRIQQAILPTRNQVEETFQEVFIYYKPKDIVAGDFYWMEISDGKRFISVADCTGHGVPGAMMSVMCSNILTKCTTELGLNKPAGILDKAVELLEDHFSKSTAKVNDGMDLALCSIDESGKILEFSGANNPLFLIRDSKLFEYKADKQPIGRHDHRKPFTNHCIDLRKGDCIYLFSDGYADQFGGPKGKKFKYKQLEEILLANCNKNMSDQREILKMAFEGWKGTLDQMDDVCVIGFRV